MSPGPAGVGNAESHRARTTPDLEALGRLMAQGDEAAFAELYDATFRVAFGIIARVVRDQSQSEEVLQEVMVEVWRTAARSDLDRGSVSTRVATIAHRRAVDRVRSARIGRVHVERDHGGRTMVAPDLGEKVTESLQQGVDRERVTRALSRITVHQRESIELAFYGGHTHAEVSSLLDLPLGTVKNTIRDGMIHLREGLGAAP